MQEPEQHPAQAGAVRTGHPSVSAGEGQCWKRTFRAAVCVHEPKGPGGGTGRLHHTRGKTDVLISSPWYPKTIQYNLLNSWPEEV